MPIFNVRVTESWGDLKQIKLFCSVAGFEQECPLVTAHSRRSERELEIIVKAAASCKHREIKQSYSSVRDWNWANFEDITTFICVNCWSFVIIFDLRRMRERVNILLLYLLVELASLVLWDTYKFTSMKTLLLNEMLVLVYIRVVELCSSCQPEC